MENMEIEEPLKHLSRAELQLEIMKNIEREIMNTGHRNKLRFWWERVPNWVRVQTFINRNTIKAGSTSSGQQCHFIGADPDGKTFFNKQ